MWTRDDIRRRIDEVVRHLGDWVWVEQGLPCGCRAGDGVRLSAGCRVCEGEGLVWLPPRKLKGIVMSVKGDRQLASYGWVNPGDLIFWSDTRHRIQDFDRITLTVPDHAEPELIVRGKSHADGVPGLRLEEDRLAYRAVAPVVCVLANDPARVFVHGDDYVFDGKAIRWLRPPLSGTPYTIQYQALTEWLCFASPWETIDRGRHMAQRVLLRRRHLVNLRENPKRDTRAALGM